jgi:hypothetical protein
MSVENALATGVSSERAASPACARPRLPALRAIDRAAGRVADRARGAGHRLHGHQQSLDVGMLNDRARSVLGAERAALLLSRA